MPTEPLTFEVRHYCLMTLNGRYQWRYTSYSSDEDPAVSPVFDTLEEAQRWPVARDRGEKLNSGVAQWQPIQP